MSPSTAWSAHSPTATCHPGFDRSITDEKIARGDLRARTCRNRRIGDLLKELRLIEGRNTGFPMVRKALEENGSDPFIIDMDPERTYVSIIIPIHREFLTEKTNRKRALYEELIEEHLSKRPLTPTELARAMGYRSISAKLSRTVKSMADRGKINRSISDGSVIRYFTAGLSRPGPADPD